MGGQYFGRREKEDCPLTVKYELFGFNYTKVLFQKVEEELPYKVGMTVCNGGGGGNFSFKGGSVTIKSIGLKYVMVSEPCRNI
jgi:hypothetical protein